MIFTNTELRVNSGDRRMKELKGPSGLGWLLSTLCSQRVQVPTHFHELDVVLQLGEASFQVHLPLLSPPGVVNDGQPLVLCVQTTPVSLKTADYFVTANGVDQLQLVGLRRRLDSVCLDIFERFWRQLKTPRTFWGFNFMGFGEGINFEGSICRGLGEGYNRPLVEADHYIL